MKNKLRKFFMGAVVVLASTAANANLINVVDHGTYFTDTVNHLDWLKITPATTARKSYDQVSQELGSGGALSGWSYASAAQFEAMFVSITNVDLYMTNLGCNCVPGSEYWGYTSGEVYGTPLPGSLAADTYATWNQFYDLAFNQPANTAGISNRGILSNDVSADIGSPSHLVSWITYDLLKISPATMDMGWSNAYLLNTKIGNGSYLIKTASAADLIPEPPTLALLGLGLVGIGAASRRKKVLNG